MSSLPCSVAICMLAAICCASGTFVQQMAMLLALQRCVQPAVLCVCSDFGKAAHIEAFSGARCALRRSDGAEVAANVSPHPLMLHQLVAASKWSQATRLCRFVKVCTAVVVPAGDSAAFHGCFAAAASAACLSVGMNH